MIDVCPGREGTTLRIHPKPYPFVAHDLLLIRKHCFTPLTLVVLFEENICRMPLTPCRSRKQLGDAPQTGEFFLTLLFFHLDKDHSYEELRRRAGIDLILLRRDLPRRIEKVIGAIRALGPDVYFVSKDYNNITLAETSIEAGEYAAIQHHISDPRGLTRALCTSPHCSRR
jgi:hypothetical protein